MRAAIDRIQSICDGFDKQLMLKMARTNYEAMIRSLQGFIV